MGRLEAGFRHMLEKARTSATWLLVDAREQEALDHFNEATRRCKRRREPLELEAGDEVV